MPNSTPYQSEWDGEKEKENGMSISDQLPSTSRHSTPDFGCHLPLVVWSSEPYPGFTTVMYDDYAANDKMERKKNHFRNANGHETITHSHKASPRICSFLAFSTRFRSIDIRRFSGFSFCRRQYFWYFVCVFARSGFFLFVSRSSAIMWARVVGYFMVSFYYLIISLPQW